MAVTHRDGDQPGDLLPCGRLLGTLYEHLRAGATDAHEQACPSCRQAADDLAPALQAIVILAAHRPEPPAGFTESVMTRVRADTRRIRYLDLPVESAAVTITEHAAAAIMSAAVDAIPGVTSRGCRFPASRDPAHVAISISIRYGLHLAAAAGHLRATLREAVLAQLGVHLRQIDVTVDDVHPAAGAP